VLLLVAPNVRPRRASDQAARRDLRRGGKRTIPTSGRGWTADFAQPTLWAELSAPIRD